MRMRSIWGQCAAIAGLSIAVQFAIGAPPEPPIPRAAAGGGAGEHLNAALAAYQRNDFEGAYTEAAAAASDAGFLAQDERTRHTTLSLAAETAHGAEAQMARILAQLKQADFAAAFHSSEALCAGEALPQRVAAECGHSFARLVAAVAAKQVALDVDDVRLTQRAEQYFEKALAENAEDFASWCQLMDLVAQRRDRAYAKELLPRAERIQAAHPHMGILARSVAWLCAVTGDFPAAIGYATVWQRSAISSADRATASSYLSTLRTNLERRVPASGPTSN